MARIQHSLHSRNVGVGNTTVPTSSVPGAPGAFISRGGFISGPHGNQVVLPGPNHVAIWDDFAGLDTVAPNVSMWSFLEGTDSATSVAVQSAAKGGVLLMTTGDAGTGFAADAVQLVNGRHWYAENGGLRIQARVKLSAITTCTAFIGFTDNVALEQSILYATGTTYTTNASDACGFLFDTVSTADKWCLTGVAADTDATMEELTYAPVADTYETLAVELSAAGAATFFRNGVQVGNVMTGAVTPTVALTPTIYVSKLSVAASMTMSVDYINCSMSRGVAI
jgi:hypothetical protein